MHSDEINEQSAQRQAKLKALRDTGENPYPNDFRRDCSAAELLEQYRDTDADVLEAEAVSG